MDQINHHISETASAMQENSNGRKSTGKVRTFCICLFTFAASLTCAALTLSDFGSAEFAGGYAPYNDDLIYSGELTDGKYNGIGELVFAGGDSYTGGFTDGRFDRNGVFKSSNGWTFAGVFEQGVATGSFTTADGGSVLIILQDGSVVYSPEGRLVYSGEAGSRGQHGTGVHNFIDGRVYQGKFRFGLADGEGTLLGSDGVTIYSGGFRSGLFDGVGFLNLENAVYEGNFKGGLFDGLGVLTVSDGMVFDGTWAGGVLVNAN